jgi:hypothetical protein
MISHCIGNTTFCLVTKQLEEMEIIFLFGFQLLCCYGVEEMAQQFRALSFLAEDLGSIQHSHGDLQSSPVPGDWCSPLTSTGNRTAHGTYTYTLEKHSYTER